MATTKTIVTGISKIDRKLRQLPWKVQRKVVSQSIREGLKVIAAEVKSSAPRRTGTMAGAVKVRKVKTKKRDSVMLETRISGGVSGLVKNQPSGRWFYPALVEYLHDNFMHRSFRMTARAERDHVMQLILAGIEREARK